MHENTSMHGGKTIQQFVIERIFMPSRENNIVASNRAAEKQTKDIYQFRLKLQQLPDSEDTHCNEGTKKSCQ